MLVMPRTVHVTSALHYRPRLLIAKNQHSRVYYSEEDIGRIWEEIVIKQSVMGQKQRGLKHVQKLSLFAKSRSVLLLRDATFSIVTSKPYHYSRFRL